MSQDYFLSWDELHRDSRELARRLLEGGGRFQGIIAMARGGLVPAAILARELDIRRVDTLCIASYQHRQQGEAEILKAWPADDSGAGWLLVDDLVDTGNTARIARRLLPEVTLVALYAKPQGEALADLFVRRFAQDCWLHFPWDSANAAYAEPLAAAAPAAGDKRP